MRRLGLLVAGLVIFASQAEAKASGPIAVRSHDRAWPSQAGANQLSGIGLIPTLIIGAGLAVWLIKEAGDSSKSP